MTILIVDDDAQVRDILRTLLTILGFTVVEASDAYNGVQAFRQAKPDAAILDFEMPAGGGLQVLTTLRTLDAGARLPVIFLSGLPKMQVQANVINQTLVSFLEKPLKSEEFKATLAEALASVGKKLPGAAPSPAPQAARPAAHPKPVIIPPEDDVLDLDAA